MPKHGHGIFVEDELWNSVVTYAVEDQRSCSQVVNMAIEEFFKNKTLPPKKKE